MTESKAVTTKWDVDAKWIDDPELGPCVEMTVGEHTFYLDPDAVGSLVNALVYAVPTS
jgi:hypothetical protein